MDGRSQKKSYSLGLGVGGAGFALVDSTQKGWRGSSLEGKGGQPFETTLNLTTLGNSDQVGRRDGKA